MTRTPQDPLGLGTGIPGWRNIEDIRKAELLPNFAKMLLGLKLHPWQEQVMEAIQPRGSKVALKACNGSGKTSVVAAASVIWHLVKFPGALVVCTAGVYRQVTKALWPSLQTYSNALGGASSGFVVTEDEVRYTKPGQKLTSRAIGFSAQNPQKAEGWHCQGPSNNLLYVVDESKGVADGIFQAMERCQPSRTLLISSPGGAAGYFYDTFKRADGKWKLFTVTAFDCPHIAETSWIQDQIERWGEEHPFVRSSVFAEFVDDDGTVAVLRISDWQAIASKPPEVKDDGPMVAGCDFAAGGDENVLCVRKGSRIVDLLRWKDRDTMAATGRFIANFKKFGIAAENIYADSGGIGHVICDALREQGWDVNRVNFGSKANRDDRFRNKVAEMWVEFGQRVEKRSIDLGPIAGDEIAMWQFVNRKLNFPKDGRIYLESKEEMRARGLSSPDRADAIVLAFEGGGGNAMDGYVREMGRMDDRTLFERMEDEVGPAYGADSDYKHLEGCYPGG